ncbi:MAG TPA: GNAT family N-acetyltransferase [Kofleriaceae bacterium]|nr:GNAT family N-acetyltransferase [Kofleriaceae bacterium]
MFFDADYLERATLRDGTEVVLRLVRPDDKERLRTGFDRLSAESRYRRFFTAKNELSDDELRYLTEVDQVHHVAIGATSADGARGLGVARFIELAGEPGCAEAAVAVADELQGRGLGSLLLRRLVGAARERGIDRFRCEVLGSNDGMTGLLRALAPEASCEIEQGVMRMEFVLPGAAPPHAPIELPRETGLYRLLTLIAEGAIAWRARWQAIGERLLSGGHPDAAASSGDEGGHPIETAAAAAIDDPVHDEPS